jgi:hypothetical protein
MRLTQAAWHDNFFKFYRRIPMWVDMCSRVRRGLACAGQNREQNQGVEQ